MFHSSNVTCYKYQTSYIDALHVRSAVRNRHNSTSYVVLQNQLITETYVSTRTIKKMKTKLTLENTGDR